MKLLTLLCSILFGTTIAIAQTGTITIKGEPFSGNFQQALLDSKYPNSSDVSQTEITSCAWTCVYNGVPECYFRSLLKFNVTTTLPVNAVVTSAKLYLYPKTTNINGEPGSPMYGSANTSLMKRVISPWPVNNLGWANQPSATPRNQKTLAQSTSAVQNYIVDITDFVQLWRNRPDSNFGMLIGLQNEIYYNSMIFSSGQAVDSLRPKLVIEFNLINNTSTNIGIGTTNPTARLHVFGNLRFEGLPASDSLKTVLAIDSNGYVFRKKLDSTTAFASNAWLTNGNAASAGAFVGTTNSMPFILKTNNTERLIVSAGGNVGINTASPTAKLDVDGSVRLRNLAAGTGNALVINANGEVQRSSAVFGRSQSSEDDITTLKAEIEALRKQVQDLRKIIEKLATAAAGKP